MPDITTAIVPPRDEDYDSDDDLVPDDTVTGGMFVAAINDYREFQSPREPVNMPTDPSEFDYMELLLDSYWMLVVALADEEEDDWMAGSQGSTFMTHVMMILCSSCIELLVSIVDGTLPRRAVDDSRPRAKRYIDLNKEERDVAVDEVDGKRVIHQPVIFGQYLVNDEGFGPTEKELAAIVILVRLYVNPGHPVFEEYVKRVNANSPRDCSRLPREVVDYFCDRISDRLPTEPSDTVRPRALANDAYSPTPKPGRQNRLLCLVETVCKLYYPQYMIHHHVVFRLYAPEQAWFGEMVFNRLGQASTDTGFGFYYKPPGQATFRAADIAARHYMQWAYNAARVTEVSCTFQRQQNSFDKSDWKRSLSDGYPQEYAIQLNHISKRIRDMDAGEAANWNRLYGDFNE
ncbi:hypothetical protein HDK77DRAFT_429400 [Phyllosticta capitalensis]